jgi:hypothetical protein
MKAQAYELDCLPDRKREVAIYQFNLVAVADCPFLRVHFDGDQRSITELDEDLYVANYIIKKRPTAGRIHFVRAESLPQKLRGYDQLHEANCTFFRKRLDGFYKDALKDHKRVALFSKDFEKDVRLYLSWRISKYLQGQQDLKHLQLTWDTEEEKACVMLDLEEHVVDYLNTDKLARSSVQKALLKHYRYEGGFLFAVDEIPF